jgi:hypothetical protein
MLPPGGRLRRADIFIGWWGIAVMKHKFRRLVNVEFSFY